METQFKEAVLELLEESFENVHGYYLDKRIRRCWKRWTASAQRRRQFRCRSRARRIAGHVEHVRFYLAVFIDMAHGKEVDPIDWEQSWLVKEVTPDEWEALKSRLRETYLTVRRLIETNPDWEGEGRVGSAIAVVVHTAYHLGAIRLALYGIQSGKGAR